MTIADSVALTRLNKGKRKGDKGEAKRTIFHYYPKTYKHSTNPLLSSTRAVDILVLAHCSIGANPHLVDRSLEGLLDAVIVYQNGKNSSE